MLLVITVKITQNVQLKIKKIVTKNEVSSFAFKQRLASTIGAKEVYSYMLDYVTYEVFFWGKRQVCFEVILAKVISI